MAKETRPKDYPKLKNYQPTRFMLLTSHYDKAKADRAVTIIENLCHTKGKWEGKRFWLLPWQEQLIRDIFGIVASIMALDRCLRNQSEPQGSVYDERGLLVF